MPSRVVACSWQEPLAPLLPCLPARAEPPGDSLRLGDVRVIADVWTVGSWMEGGVPEAKPPFACAMLALGPLAEIPPGASSNSDKISISSISVKFARSMRCLQSKGAFTVARSATALAMASSTPARSTS